MATSSGVTGLRPVAPLDPALPVNPVGDAREDALLRLSQIATGKEYLATVLSRFTDGQFLVKVADAAVRMTLPAGVKPGDDIKLILVANQPRPAFLLASSDAPSGSVRTALSNTGRLIDNLLQSAQRQGLPERVVGQTPLLPAPAASGPVNAGQIAHALQDSLGSSGLFYESHVGEWASGARSLESLMREPQASMARPIDPAQNKLPLPTGASAGTGPGDDAQSGTNPQGQRAGGAQNAQGATSFAYGPSGLPLSTTAPPTTIQNAVAAMPAAVLAAAPQADTLLQPPAPADPEAARLVSLQLGVMEQNRAAWQGELWAGQRLQWDVSEEVDEDSRNDRAAPEQQTWKSNVRFELPSLGAVSATLHLQGNQVRIQLRAAESSTVSLLQEHGPALASALDIAGSRLDQLSVRQETES